MPRWATRRATSSISKSKSFPTGAQPEVEAVGLGCGTPHDRGNNNTFQYGADRMVSFQVFIGDSTYFRMLGLERLRDNHVAVADGSAASWNFWASNVWYINQYALRELGIAEDAPDFKLGNDLSYPVVIAGISRRSMPRPGHCCAW